MGNTCSTDADTAREQKTDSRRPSAAGRRTQTSLNPLRPTIDGADSLQSASKASMSVIITPKSFARQGGGHGIVTTASGGSEDDDICGGGSSARPSPMWRFPTDDDREQEGSEYCNDRQQQEYDGSNNIDTMTSGENSHNSCDSTNNNSNATSPTTKKATKLRMLSQSSGPHSTQHRTVAHPHSNTSVVFGANTPSVSPSALQRPSLLPPATPEPLERLSRTERKKRGHSNPFQGPASCRDERFTPELIPLVPPATPTSIAGSLTGAGAANATSTSLIRNSRELPSGNSLVKFNAGRSESENSDGAADTISYSRTTPFGSVVTQSSIGGHGKVSTSLAASPKHNGGQAEAVLTVIATTQGANSSSFTDDEEEEEFISIFAHTFETKRKGQQSHDEKSVSHGAATPIFTKQPHHQSSAKHSMSVAGDVGPRNVPFTPVPMPKPVASTPHLFRQTSKISSTLIGSSSFARSTKQQHASSDCQQKGEEDALNIDDVSNLSSSAYIVGGRAQRSSFSGGKSPTTTIVSATSGRDSTGVTTPIGMDHSMPLQLPVFGPDGDAVAGSSTTNRYETTNTSVAHRVRRRSPTVSFDQGNGDEENLESPSKNSQRRRGTLQPGDLPVFDSNKAGQQDAHQQQSSSSQQNVVVVEAPLVTGGGGSVDDTRRINLRASSSMRFSSTRHSPRHTEDSSSSFFHQQQNRPSHQSTSTTENFGSATCNLSGTCDTSPRGITFLAAYGQAEPAELPTVVSSGNASSSSLRQLTGIAGMGSTSRTNSVATSGVVHCGGSDGTPGGQEQDLASWTTAAETSIPAAYVVAPPPVMSPQLSLITSVVSTSSSKATSRCVSPSVSSVSASLICNGGVTTTATAAAPPSPAASLCLSPPLGNSNSGAHQLEGPGVFLKSSSTSSSGGGKPPTF